MKIQEASKIAIDLCYKLSPFCDRINIAGSIRRQCPEVKDIEVVCVPKRIQVPNRNLFDKDGVVVVIDQGFVDSAKSLGKVIKGTPQGKYMKIELQEGIMLDLFIPDAHDYFRQYAIRTGSATYAEKIIALGWRKKGWCGSDKGLRKVSQCLEIKTADGKSKWRCIYSKPQLPPVWESEEEFFKWIGVQIVHPSKRNI